jgi:hypothetical protein
MYADNYIHTYMHTAVVGTVRPLHGSRRNSHETLFLFQKHLLCWEHEYIVFRNKINAVKVTLCMLVYNLFLLKAVDTPLRPIA